MSLPHPPPQVSISGRPVGEWKPQLSVSADAVFITPAFHAPSFEFPVERAAEKVMVTDERNLAGAIEKVRRRCDELNRLHEHVERLYQLAEQMLAGELPR